MNATTTAAQPAARPATVVLPLRGEYPPGSGKPTLILRRSETDKYPFQFGRAKAKLILANIDAIRAFAEEAE